jgi:hypothetical protein
MAKEIIRQRSMLVNKKATHLIIGRRLPVISGN